MAPIFKGLPVSGAEIKYFKILYGLSLKIRFFRKNAAPPLHLVK
jgi:hypothetical protein